MEQSLWRVVPELPATLPLRKFRPDSIVFRGGDSANVRVGDIQTERLQTTGAAGRQVVLLLGEPIHHE